MVAWINLDKIYQLCVALIQSAKKTNDSYNVWINYTSISTLSSSLAIYVYKHNLT